MCDFDIPSVVITYQPGAVSILCLCSERSGTTVLDEKWTVGLMRVGQNLCCKVKDRKNFYEKTRVSCVFPRLCFIS